MDLRDYQNKTTDWMLHCFGHDLATSRKERAQRFIEEALELAQAEGLTRDDCDLMINYVYSRPVGRTEQEVGGVMLTLAGVCWNANIDLNAAAIDELNRVREPEMIEKIRGKQASKSAILGITSQADAPPQNMGARMLKRLFGGRRRDAEGKIARAHRVREERQYPKGSPWSEFAGIREENAKKQYDKVPPLAAITEISMNYTQETGELVLTVYDVDGNKVSLWCQGDGIADEKTSVRAITNY